MIKRGYDKLGEVLNLDAKLVRVSTFVGDVSQFGRANATISCDNFVSNLTKRKRAGKDLFLGLFSS